MPVVLGYDPERLRYLHIVPGPQVGYAFAASYVYVYHVRVRSTTCTVVALMTSSSSQNACHNSRLR